MFRKFESTQRRGVPLVQIPWSPETTGRGRVTELSQSCTTIENWTCNKDNNTSEDDLNTQ